MRKRGGGTVEEKQREAVAEMMQSQDILARFLDLSTHLQPTRAYRAQSRLHGELARV